MADVNHYQSKGRTFAVLTSPEDTPPLPAGMAAHPSSSHRMLPVAGPTGHGVAAQAAASDAIGTAGRILWIGASAVVWSFQTLARMGGPPTPSAGERGQERGVRGPVSDRSRFRVLEGQMARPTRQPVRAPSGRAHLRLLGDDPSLPPAAPMVEQPPTGPASA